MKNLFNVENPVWVFMGKLVDMLLLSGLWVICSLPVVTIGASTAALYYVTLKWGSSWDAIFICIPGWTGRWGSSFCGR